MMRLVLSGILLLITAEIVGQKLFTRQYSIADGLKHSEVYWVSLDDDNQVWIHNGQGWVARYDGIDFNFLPKDSLKHTGFSSHLIHHGEYGWMYSQQNQLIVFKKDGSYFNKIELQDIFSGPFISEDKVSIYLREKHRILSFDVNLSVIDSFDIPLHTIKGTDYNKQYGGLHQYKLKKPIFYIAPLEGIEAGFLFNTITKQSRKSSERIYEIELSDYYLTADLNNRNLKILKLKDSLSLYFNTIHTFPPENEYVVIANRKNQHFFMQNQYTGNGIQKVLYQWDEKTVQEMGKLPSIQHIGLARVDDNEHIWMGSHEGLYKINPHLLFFSTEEKNMVSALHSIVEGADGTIWFAGYKTGLSYFDGKINRGPQSSLAQSNYLPGGSLINNEVHFIISSDNQIVIPGKSGIKRKKFVFTSDAPTKRIAGYIIKQIDDTIYIGLQGKGFGIVKKTDAVSLHIKPISHKKGLTLENVLTIAKDKAGRIWVGRSSQGIGLYDPKIDSAYTWRIDSENEDTFGSISSVIDRNGNLWFGSNQGLYFLENPDQVQFGDDLFSKSKYISFPDNDRSMVASVIESNGYLVAGNNTAVHFLHLDSFYHSSNDPLIYSLKYGEDLGGDGTEQNCMLEDSKGYLWIGSQTGATRMDIRNYSFDNSPIEIEIKDVITGQQTIAYDGGIIIIPKDNRNFSLKVHPKVNRSLQNNIYYNYHLVNESSDTLITEYNINDPYISMSYIPSGDYTFHVEAYKNGRKTDDLNVEICAPRTLAEHPFFWAGMIGSLLIGLASFFIIRGRQKRKLLEKDLALIKLKNDKTNLQVQAIISSFNPHFINNSLHWAQSRYKKDQSLVTLIGRLSKNIQYIFTKTRTGKAYHTLAEELELVKNYVTIQKIRFDDGFELRLPSYEDLKNYNDTPVLLMQLQIHVENAIEHGLRNRMDSSFVQIEIEESNDHLTVHIIDDGAGREKAKELQSQGTQKGIKMLEELHHIFNQKNTTPIETSYEDNIYTDTAIKDKYGTRVSIKLPKQYSYEIEET